MGADVQDLTHDDPSKSAGKVYAIDPSSDLLIDMVNIANENSISNICTRMTFIGSTSDGKFAKIDDMDIENLGVLHLDLEGKVRVSIFVSCENSYVQYEDSAI